MDEFISMEYGSGGEKYRELVEEIYLPAYSNEYIAPLTDSAVLPGAERLAMTTDSYVVTPLFFPGGDIGSLAVSGTVNDLAVSGSCPKFISVAMVIVAGLTTEVLRRVVHSIADTAAIAGVKIVTGDTKLIERNNTEDGLYINTAGIGFFPQGREYVPQKIQAGDKIIISGCIASHGMAIMSKRNGLDFSPELKSDAYPMNKLIESVMQSETAEIHAMRDPTRGGVAATLNEWVTPDTDIVVYDKALPIRRDISKACDILGLDPLFIANEGVVVFAVPAECADSVLALIKKNPRGKNAVIAGEVRNGGGRVLSATEYGSFRRIIMPRGEFLPRIC